MRLKITNVDAYLEKMAQSEHLAHSKEERRDLLKEIATLCKKSLALPKLPIHFFDVDGQPLVSIDKMLSYLAKREERPVDTVIYCQDKILFR